MESKEDLQKLTVTQLKDKLKQRKLPTAGTKTDLVARLYESYEEEEKLLTGETAEDLDADDLLGTSSLTEPNEEALLLGLTPKNNGSEAPKTASPVKPTPAPPKPEPQKRAQIQSPNITAKDNIAEKPAQKPAEKPQVNNDGDAKSTTPTTGQEAKPAKVPIRPKISVGDAEDAKRRRAERFGLSEQKSTESTEKSTAASNAPKTTSAIDKHPISLNSNSKLLERAKRFGLPVTEDSNNGASKAKVPRVIASGAPEEDAKKQARLQRFTSN